MEDIRSPDQDLNPGPPDYKILQHLVLLPSRERRAMASVKAGHDVQTEGLSAVEGWLGCLEFLMESYEVFVFLYFRQRGQEVQNCSAVLFDMRNTHVSCEHRSIEANELYQN